MSETSRDKEAWAEFLDGKFAIVWSPETGWRLITPTGDGSGGQIVHPEALALTGAFIRLDQDQEFRDECAEWFMSHSQ